MIQLIRNCYDNSIKGKGRLTEKGRLKIIQTHTGKIVSSDTRRKQSIAHTGFRHTEKAKLKISLANKGKVVSDETKKKMSIAAKGKPKSESHRVKIAEKIIEPEQSLFQKKQKERLVFK